MTHASHIAQLQHAVRCARIDPGVDTTLHGPDLSSFSIVIALRKNSLGFWQHADTSEIARIHDCPG